MATSDIHHLMFDATSLGLGTDGARVYARDHNDPKNRKEWKTQHDALKFIDPPYVYHVVRSPTTFHLVKRVIEDMY